MTLPAPPVSYRDRWHSVYAMHAAHRLTAVVACSISRLFVRRCGDSPGSASCSASARPLSAPYWC